MIDRSETQQADFVTRIPLPPERLDALSRDILKLKHSLNAIILAHNYQVPEIQDVADRPAKPPSFLCVCPTFSTPLLARIASIYIRQNQAEI